MILAVCLNWNSLRSLCHSVYCNVVINVFMIVMHLFYHSIATCQRPVALCCSINVCKRMGRRSAYCAPNWWSSSCLSISSRIHDSIIDSSTLLTVGVREIGRKSEFIDVSGLVFGIVKTLAFFHRDGIVAWRMLALKIAHRGSQSHGAKSRKTQLGSPSGPGALCTLIRSSFTKTVSGEITVSYTHLTLPTIYSV